MNKLRERQIKEIKKEIINKDAKNLGKHLLCKILYPIIGNLPGRFQKAFQDYFGKEYFDAGDATIISMPFNILSTGFAVGYLSSSPGIGIAAGIAELLLHESWRGAALTEMGSDERYASYDGKIPIASPLGKIISAPIELPYYAIKGIISLRRKWKDSLESRIQNELLIKENELSELKNRLSSKHTAEQMEGYLPLLVEAETSTDEKLLKRAMNVYRRQRDFESAERIAAKISYEEMGRVLRLHVGYTKGLVYLEQNLPQPLTFDKERDISDYNPASNPQIPYARKRETE